MNCFRDRGWLREEENQWLLLAMIQRGLAVHSSQTFLTCVVCKKHVHDLGECVKHCTVYKDSHQEETPFWDELAQNIQRSHSDEMTGGHSLLQRYFGEAAVGIMHKMGWERGQTLGSASTAPLRVRSSETARIFGHVSHPEMWSTLAGTLASTSWSYSNEATSLFGVSVGWLFGCVVSQKT